MASCISLLCRYGRQYYVRIAYVQNYKSRAAFSPNGACLGKIDQYDLPKLIAHPDQSLILSEETGRLGLILFGVGKWSELRQGLFAFRDDHFLALLDQSEELR